MSAQQMHVPDNPVSQDVRQDSQVADSVAGRAVSKDRPDVLECIHKQLRIILHVKECERLEQFFDKRKKCDDRTCIFIKNVFRHMKYCSAGRPCRVNHCYSIKKILAHWENCARLDCEVCLPIRQERVRRSINGMKISDNLKNLERLYLSQEDSDVIFKVKGQVFHAHGLILKAQSPVLAAALRNDMREKETGIIEIEDCDPKPFSDFLKFLYCGKLKNLSVEDLFSLFLIADKYIATDLRSLCLELIQKNLSVDTFFDAMDLAIFYSESQLLISCQEFFKTKVKEICRHENWRDFAGRNPILAKDLLFMLLKRS